MGDLVLYLGFAAIGYFFGSKIRDQKEKFGWTGTVQMAALMILVLLMGLRMGANEEITANLGTIGVTALLLTIAAQVGSLLAITLTRKLFGIDRYGRMQNKKKEAEAETAEADAEAEPAEEIGQEEKSGGNNVMTIIIIAAVAVGMLAGYFVIRPAFAQNMDQFADLVSLGIKIGLCLLLVFVGLDLGLDGTVISNFKKVGVRIFAFPVAIVIGTMAGMIVCSMFVKVSLRECIMVGAGFGWYTLAPGIIMEAGYVSASAVAFLHNVMRELSGIILIPIVAKKIGYVETIGLPGAAAMDVCLPVVEKATRSDVAVYSFVSGLVLSILVPVLVPLLV